MVGWCLGLSYTLFMANLGLLRFIIWDYKLDFFFHKFYRLFKSNTKVWAKKEKNKQVVLASY